MIDLDDLNAEDLACAGLFRRVTDDAWRFFPDVDLAKALTKPGELAAVSEGRGNRGAPPATPARRIRRPTLEVQLRQVWKAARAAGVPIVIAIEGDRLIASPAGRPAAPSEQPNAPEFPASSPTPPGCSLFKTRVRPKDKVVL
jgi:hypothetical protein